MKFNDIENKSDFVHKMFDSIACDYDLLNQVISFGRNKIIKKQAVQKLPKKPACNVLDVCTGTGDLAIYLAKYLDEKSTITGIDFSENMLNIAKNKAKDFKNIDFIKGDALNLPFEDETFDACIVAYGLRNLEDYKKGILEMKRVTKKGGYIVNLDTGKPKCIVNIVFRLYFDNFVPFFGKIFHGNSVPYKYLPESAKTFPSQDELVKVFLELGLSEVKNYNYAFGAIAQQVAKVQNIASELLPVNN
jgi:demethylmenaquinone methyltransferase/2-methoxy-6-polyprenyl-1,4-benzoquinol methylase